MMTQAPAPSSVDRADSADEALAAIWARYRDQIDERVAMIEYAIAELDGGMLTTTARRNARRAAHMISGTVGTFGFTNASGLARRLERELELVEPGAGGSAAVSITVGELRRELKRL